MEGRDGDGAWSRGREGSSTSSLQLFVRLGAGGSLVRGLGRGTTASMHLSTKYHLV